MPQSQPSFLARRRTGPRPRTTPTNPHLQLSDNAPLELQDRVFDCARALPGVVVGLSLVSVSGTRAFHAPSSPQGARDAFMIEHEFAHLHPSSDGSLHMVLPPDVVDRVLENQWAERHPLAGRHGLPTNIVMVYGPRNADELEVVIELVRASHEHAMGGAAGSS
jgi:phospholipase/carboxylesterase